LVFKAYLAKFYALLSFHLGLSAHQVLVKEPLYWVRQVTSDIFIGKVDQLLGQVLKAVLIVKRGLLHVIFDLSRKEAPISAQFTKV
jgi:hypothetical protein